MMMMENKDSFSIQSTELLIPEKRDKAGNDNKHLKFGTNVRFFHENVCKGVHEIARFYVFLLDMSCVYLFRYGSKYIYLLFFVVSYVRDNNTYLL